MTSGSIGASYLQLGRGLNDLEKYMTIVRVYLGIVIKLDRDPEKLDPIMNPPIIIDVHNSLEDNAVRLKRVYLLHTARGYIIYLLKIRRLQNVDLEHLKQRLQEKVCLWRGSSQEIVDSLHCRSDSSLKDKATQNGYPKTDGKWQQSK